MTETAAIIAAFAATGAERVEADILLPANTMLDLYGEDIRGRAYITHDPLRGELMLRPDFTVPIVQRHMAERAEPARYFYAGPVFRQQERDATRPSEYMQVGYEVFDRSAPALIEAELFALFCEVLAPYELTASFGDIGLLRAAVAGLSLNARRREALLRHIWRPAKFRALLERFAAGVPAAADLPDAPVIGLRNPQDVTDRLALLSTEAQEAPLPAAELAAIEALIDLNCPADQAGAALAQMPIDFGGALADFDARLAAFSDAGIALDRLQFKAGFGRSMLEYYQGFVFGMQDAAGRLIATGGRYDALTEALGQGDAVPAVGGVIRPELLGDRS